jgi:aspartate aminotransferase
MDLRSNRIKSIPESATLAMAAKAREMKQRGIDVISLSLGEPDFKTPDFIVEGAVEALRSGKYFSYPPVNGYLDLRQAISEKFKNENSLEYAPDQIVVSNGAKQSIANVFMALLDPGDEVVVYTPYWVSYTAMIQLAEGKPVFVSGGIDNDFKPSADQLRSAITSKTKAVIFSSPCNPTGSVFTKEELEEMVSVLNDHPDVVVISDEIYEMINFSGAHASIGALPGMIDRTVTVNGFSKGFAMTGWRIGYIGAPLWLAKAANKMQGQYTSANNSIAQRAGLTALQGSRKPSEEMAKAYYERRALVYDLLKTLPGFKANMPQGAFYFFPDVSAYFGKGEIKNASDFCMYILEKAHVSLVTGEAFGAPDCIRLSYAASEEELKEAVARMKPVLEAIF